MRTPGRDTKCIWGGEDQNIYHVILSKMDLQCERKDIPNLKETLQNIHKVEQEKFTQKNEKK